MENVAYTLNGYLSPCCCADLLSSSPCLPPSALTLERCLKRLEWDRVRDKEQKDAADEADKERNAVQAIDW